MPPVSRARLARACREADPATVTAFVAALFAARGYTVDRESEHLLRVRPGARLFAVAPTGSGPLPSAVDAVVTVDPDRIEAGDSRVVDVDTLHEQLCYAVDRAVAEDLLATHFSIDPGESVSTDGETALTASGDSDDGDAFGGTVDAIATAKRRLDRRVLVLMLASIVLVAGYTMVGPGNSVGDSREDPTGSETLTAGGGTTPAPDQTGETPEVNVMATPAGDTDLPARYAVAAERGVRPYPPGLGPESVDDANRLAAAHRTALTNTSYTLRLQYQEFVHGRPTGVYTETVRVENQSRYGVSVTTVGNLRTTPRAIVATDVFTNSSGQHIRVQSNTKYIRTRVTPNRFLDRTAQYLRWSLSVRNSTVRDRTTAGNVTTFLVSTGEDPYLGVENASGVASVTGDGLVTYGRWSYTRTRHPDVRIVFTIQTVDVGSTTVPRPDWVSST